LVYQQQNMHKNTMKALKISHLRGFFYFVDRQVIPKHL
jgi:hypothetical protein